jgi:hypothetical protein
MDNGDLDFAKHRAIRHADTSPTVAAHTLSRWASMLSSGLIARADCDATSDLCDWMWCGLNICFVSPLFCFI